MKEIRNKCIQERQQDETYSIFNMNPPTVGGKSQKKKKKTQAKSCFKEGF